MATKKIRTLVQNKFQIDRRSQFKVKLFQENGWKINLWPQNQGSIEPDAKAQTIKSLINLNIVEPKIFYMIKTPQKKKNVNDVPHTRRIYLQVFACFQLKSNNMHSTQGKNFCKSKNNY